MNTEWSLDVLYKGLDDPVYEADFKALEEKINTLSGLAERAGKMEQKECVEALLTAKEEMAMLSSRLGAYLELRQAVNTEDGAILAQLGRFGRALTKAAPVESAVKKILAQIPDVDALAAESSIGKDYAFLLKKTKEEARHLLSDEAEEMISSMNITGGAAWEQLFSYMTSVVKVDYAGKEMTLSGIRNLAYHPDAAVRKDAYEAELACYEKIEDSIAFALNNIKNQVTMLSAKRGYESPLMMTLEQSAMSRKTLDAMITAIKEYLPVFWKYLRRKGEMLGHTKGLPWYELFAPVGKADQTYTLEEAKQYLSGTFESFTPEMSDMIKEAFENAWIDFYPRKGKVGGAFCAGLLGYRQSRILTNYDGYFGSVSTLAHELGHAFHARQMEDERPLNQDCPMPVAETASTFNEIYLVQQALKAAKGEERLNLLENNLMGLTQCVVDIYSRYLFETAVFDKSRETFLMAKDCKALMLDAQRQAYGDGLDENVLHPYMWACKSHYYSAGLSFYNFPYAFGNLFALGLYSRYEAKKEDFVGRYKRMLAATSRCTVEEAGKVMGVDVSEVDFWRECLAQAEMLVDEFLAETPCL